MSKESERDEENCDLLQDLRRNSQFIKSSTSENKKKSSIRSVIAQCLVTGAVMLSTAGCGMPIGYSAILLPQLKSTNGSMHIDDDMGSWIASIHSAATPLGSLMSGMLMDMFGRKTTLQIASIPLVLGWILIAFSSNHALILLGRLVAGIAVGFTAAPSQVMIGEISEPHLRGIFSSVPFTSYAFGILVVYALGSWLHWRLVAALCAVLPIIATIVLLFLPETPIWLIKKGKSEEARQALCWLRGDDVIKAKKEFQALVENTESEDMQPKTSSWKLFLQPEIIKPFLVINIFNFLQVLSGTYLVVFYAVDIISHISNENIDNFLAAVLTACVRFMFTIVSSVLLGLIGRRTLALSSGLGSAFSALCLGILLSTHSTDNNGYIVALCILFYVASNTLGFMTLPGILTGELFPTRFRGIGGGLSMTIFNVLTFAAAKMFPFIKNSIDVSGVFWIFGGASILGSIFMYVMLPETKGKTLSEIEDYFKQNNVTWVGRKKDTKENSKTETNTVVI